MFGLGEHPLTAISERVAASAFSQSLQATEWIIPAVQVLHILSVAIVFSSIMFVTLAALRVHAREQPLFRTWQRFAPALYAALPVLLVTGLMMIVAEPERALPNPVFQLKMGLLAMALLVTLAVTGRAFGPPARGGTIVRVAALASLALWTGVLVAGRWIAYALTK